MRILITGSRGQLGWDVSDVLGLRHERVAVDIEELDITDAGQVEKFVDSIRPDIILNCAAYTRVDACETEKEAAWRTNVEGPKNLAKAAARQNSRIIHISTDYVFDGNKRLPAFYIEEDEPNPCSYYGITKYEGEKAVRQEAPRHQIVRTAWLFGIGGHNFLKTMLCLALEDPCRKIKVVDDQYGSPTWSRELANQLARLIEIESTGIYHATANGYCSWYGLARYFLEKMQVAHTIVPCRSDDYPTPAKRPKNSVLENRRLKTEGIDLLSDWRAGVDQFVALCRSQLLAENGKVRLDF